MSAPRTCHSCRHWQQLSKRAIIGRCTQNLADAGYTHYSDHCARHGLVSSTRGPDLVLELAAQNRQLTAENRQLARTSRGLLVRTATNVEITQQLAAEMLTAAGKTRTVRRHRKRG